MGEAKKPEEVVVRVLVSVGGPFGRAETKSAFMTITDVPGWSASESVGRQAQMMAEQILGVPVEQREGYGHGR